MATIKIVCTALMLVLLAVWTTCQRLRPIPFSCPAFSYDAVYDLQNNVNTTHPSVTLIGGITGSGCSSQGVLKLALASSAVDPSRRRVLVDLYFTSPTNWVFNLGDSSTNNGWAGDGGNQRWDAEVHGIGTTFAAFLSDNGGSSQAFNILNLYSSRLTLIAGDGYISWLPNDNNKYNYYYNPSLFALNGQYDPDGPVNYDLYLGLNRVIASASRTGTGLCKVGIKFLPAF